MTPVMMFSKIIHEDTMQVNIYPGNLRERGRGQRGKEGMRNTSIYTDGDYDVHPALGGWIITEGGNSIDDAIYECAEDAIAALEEMLTEQEQS